MSFDALSGRYPVLKMDDQFCLFTMEKIDFSDVPPGAKLYHLQVSEKATGAQVFAQDMTVTDSSVGSLICSNALPLDSEGSFYPEHVSALLITENPTLSEFLALSPEQLSQKDDKGFLYLSSFGPVPVYPDFDMYGDNDNLYLGFDFYDEEEQMFDHFAAITTNIDTLPYPLSAIDTNNNGDKIIPFLERNGFGEMLHGSLHNGFCAYPVFRFNEQLIHRLDPKFLEDYAQIHGAAPSVKNSGRLDNKIHEATAKVTEQEKLQHDRWRGDHPR